MAIFLYCVFAAFCITLLLSWIDFFCYMFTGKRSFKSSRYPIELIVMLFPTIGLIIDLSATNSCCGDTALFSPAHRLSVNMLAILCLAAFFYSSYRKKLAPPLLEVIINCLLIIGIALDIFTGIQLQEWPFWVLIILPVAHQFLLILAENHRLALDKMSDQEVLHQGFLLALCRRVLFRPAWQKFPLLLLLCLPLLTLLIAALLLFGQKPDSFVRAFTDTYKHGFSQLDYKCAGVVCGGHFLCTIAAKGHPALVRPIRVGVRAGRLIHCNRQLLVSNAFEELLEQKLPWLHRPIRALYNKIGDGIHRYYDIFDNRMVSNTIYVLMKPMEWLFVLVLYLTDRNPETRIAQQYLHRDHRHMLGQLRNPRPSTH